MAIAFRVGATNGANATDITIAKSALTGLADGDVIVFAMSQYNTGTDSFTSSDATVVDSHGTIAGADLVSAYAYYVVTSASGAPTTFTFSTASATEKSIVALVFSGVDNSTPIDTAASHADGSNNADPDGHAVTTTNANAMALTSRHLSNQNTAVGHATGAPSGWTTPTGGFSTYEFNDTSTTELAYLLTTTAGTYDPGVWSNGGETVSEYHVRSMSLKEAAAGSTYDETGRATTVTGTTAVTDSQKMPWYDEAVGKPGHLVFLNGNAHRYRTDDHADYAPPATTTVMDLRAEFTLQDTSAQQTMMAQWSAAQQSWVMAHSAGGYKTLRLYWSTTGADLLAADATTTLPADDGDRVQVSMRLLQDNGIDPDYEVEFWYKINSTDALNLTTGWTQLGSTVVGAGTTTLWNSTSEITVGRYNNGSSDTQEMDIFQVAILNGSTTKMWADFRTGEWISHGADAQGHIWNRTGGTTDLKHHSTTTGSGRQTTGTVTVTVTDVYTSGTTYDETGRATTIASTVNILDAQGYAELLRAISVTATTALTDAQGYAELLRATTGTVTTAVTDVQSFVDLLLATSVAATITVTDTLGSGGPTYDETGRATTITATIGMTDLVRIFETLLATTVTATTTVTDRQDYVDTLATVIASTQTILDILGFHEPNLATTIAATVDMTDVQDYADLLATVITSASTVTDVQAYVDLLATAIVSFMTVRDIYTPAAGDPVFPSKSVQRAGRVTDTGIRTAERLARS